MPGSSGGESGARAGVGHCRECGGPVADGDSYCRSCGAEQPPGTARSEETEQLTGAGEEDPGLDPPTAKAPRAEPPTERQAHAEETAALPPPRPAPPRQSQPPPAEPASQKPFRPSPVPEADPRPRSTRRKLIAIGAAIAIGLVGGLIAVIVINGGGSDAGSSAAGTTAPSTALDPVETLQAHFDLLQQGRFIAASDDLTPQLLDSVGGKTIWVSERIADLVIDAKLDATTVSETDSSASVRVDSLRTESITSGCTDFTGTYRLLRSGDRWLIDSADLVPHAC